MKMSDQIVKPVNTQKDIGVAFAQNHIWTANANKRLSKAMQELW